MGTTIGVSAIVAVYAVLVGLLVWVGRRARRRGTGGNVLGAFDEIWHPAGYRHRIEVERHDTRVESPPSPGDQPQLRIAGRPRGQQSSRGRHGDHPSSGDRHAHR